MPEQKAWTKPKLLLGEGAEEVMLFTEIVKHLDLMDVMEVRAYEGKSKLGSYLEPLPLTTGFLNLVSIGITCDADEDAAKSFAHIRQTLAAAGLPVPVALRQPAHGPPRVTAAVLPIGRTSGMLEDLCLESKAQDLAMACVEEFLRCTEARTGRVPRPRAKARAHAFLASQANPTRAVGQAARDGVWAFDDAAFALLCEFIRAL